MYTTLLKHKPRPQGTPDIPLSKSSKNVSVSSRRWHLRQMRWQKLSKGAKLSPSIQILFGLWKWIVSRLRHWEILPHFDRVNGGSDCERRRQLLRHRATQLVHRRRQLHIPATPRQLLEAARQRRSRLQWISHLEAGLRDWSVVAFVILVRVVQSVEWRRTKTQMVRRYSRVYWQKLRQACCTR